MVIGVYPYGLSVRRQLYSPQGDMEVYSSNPKSMSNAHYCGARQSSTSKSQIWFDLSHSNYIMDIYLQRGWWASFVVMMGLFMLGESLSECATCSKVHVSALIRARVHKLSLLRGAAEQLFAPIVVICWSCLVISLLFSVERLFISKVPHAFPVMYAWLWENCGTFRLGQQCLQQVAKFFVMLP